MGNLSKQLTSISELDELIAFTTKTELVDDLGAIELTESALGSPTIRAKVRYDSTNEAERAMQEKFEQNIKVWVRTSSCSGVTIESGLNWNGVRWDIYAIETTPKHRFTVIKARSITQ